MLAEGYRDGKAHIAEPDDGYRSLFHLSLLAPVDRRIFYRMAEGPAYVNKDAGSLKALFRGLIQDLTHFNRSDM
jgi:hypothetical protein